VICERIAEVAKKHASGPVDRILLGGGGVKNRVLFAAFEQRAGVRIQLTDDFGVPASHREAVAMAVLGALCQDRVPITLPQVTAVRQPAPIAGVWQCPSAARRSGAVRH
jgi:1,6-anhydro-N-acetylmuramate kinase